MQIAWKRAFLHLLIERYYYFLALTSFPVPFFPIPYDVRSICSMKGQLQAVLQKHEEEHKERSFTVLLLCLEGHSEQFCNECRLSQAVSFDHSLHLPFPHPVSCFISLHCSPGRLERQEAHAWFEQSFEKAGGPVQSGC